MFQAVGIHNLKSSLAKIGFVLGVFLTKRLRLVLFRGWNRYKTGLINIKPLLRFRFTFYEVSEN